MRDSFILLASIIAAIFFSRLGFLDYFSSLTGNSLALSSLVAGAFFTSVFTVAPAGVALVAISQSFPPVLVAFFGALGAVAIDLVIISFIRKDVAEDLEKLSEAAFKRHLIEAFQSGYLKWAAFLTGMFFIATPLPDELGLFFIGVSKVRHRLLPIIFFVSHFFGIWALISIVRAL